MLAHATLALIPAGLTAVAQTVVPAESPRASSVPASQAARTVSAIARAASLLAPTGVTVDESAYLGEVSAYETIRLIPGPDSRAARSSNGELVLDAGRPTHSVIARVARNGTLSRLRSLDLARNQILVVAVDAENRAKWLTTIADPRVLRTEFPDQEGRWGGPAILLPDTEFMVSIPTGRGIVAVNFYLPQMLSSGATVQPIGNARVR